MVRSVDIGRIQERDLIALIESRVAEGRTLEYKLQLPGGSDADRKEFLSDVTSFTNSTGGVILYGVATIRDANGHDTGVPEALVGIHGLNADKEVRRLESMLRDAVAPPLTSQVRYQIIQRDNEEPPILAVGVFRSFAGPHQVVFAGSSRFWVRGQTGRYEPDIAELRQLFLSSAAWLRSADEFRAARLQRVQVMPGLDRDSTTLIHLLPLAPTETIIDLAAHQSALGACPPLQHDGWSWRFNADGFMTYMQQRDSQRTLSYTQWFRSGGVEGFSSRFVGAVDDRPDRILWLNGLRTAVLDWIGKVAPVVGDPLGIDPPYAVLLTLQRTAGVRIPTGPSRLSLHTIEWDELAIPPVIYDPGKDDVKVVLKAIFDTVAQSAGIAYAPD